MQVNQESSAPGETSGLRLELLPSSVAVITMGSPDEKVITLTPARMSALRDALEKLKANPPRGLVIAGAGPDMFTAGADINIIKEVKDPETGAKLAAEGQRVFSEIAALPFTTVAAISGPCVGGGCEMVLACKHRLITDQENSTIGLPETKLGILPGFGGTQRLPRLVGLPKALDIALAGKTLRPKQALACGLVDEIVPYAQLLQRAEAIAAGASVRTRALKLTEKLLTFNSLGRSLVRRKAAQSLARQTKGFYPAPPACLDTMIYGLERGISAGLELEARELGRLICTPECKALVSIFFLTEGAKTLGKPARKSVEHLQSIVIGAGTMGAGIAGSLAKMGGSVVLKDTTDQALERGMNHVKGYLAELKYMSESERSFVLNRIETSTRDTNNQGNAKFVIEAIFEDLELKKKVLSDASKTVPQDAIVATNTSSLPVTEIAAAIDLPERVIGMHFFNPVEKMPLVEIIRAKQTNDRSIAIVAALAVKMGKFPIVVNDVPGFLVNRILAPYLTEAAYLVEEGYSVKDIDRAAVSFGMPMGPLRLLDEVGLDVAAHVSEIMIKGYGERMKGPSLAKKLVGAGRLGKKSGGGFYDFGKGKPLPHTEIRTVLGLSNAPRSGESEELQKRLILPLINEAIRCLDEGVAGQPGREAANQIDLGTVMGIGFPPFRGGALYYADSLGPVRIQDALSSLDSRFGARFAPAEGIKARIASGASFHEDASRK